MQRSPLLDVLTAHHAQKKSPPRLSPPIRVPSAAVGTSYSPGNRRSLRPGGPAVIQIQVKEPAALPNWSALTPRQFEVLQCLAEGQPTKLICRSLNMSEGTAKVHISAILRAFQVKNRAEAVVAALRMGWIQTVRTVGAEPPVGQGCHAG
jgi:DNA-binding CsgD family transcriptional regulator